ncbi:hypothetical protein EVAR_70193_1 [Eumeta japonica]|uniref:Uncharacterized protein n=1 Tax=Eumeta variegata TaxID=151549 RepID=A0A4C1SHX7_EUMVA|nr:hypothetical protein EVAR_70193_1 [Eumeta japonica]
MVPGAGGSPGPPRPPAGPRSVAKVHTTVVRWRMFYRPWPAPLCYVSNGGNTDTLCFYDIGVVRKQRVACKEIKLNLGYTFVQQSQHQSTKRRHNTNTIERHEAWPVASSALAPILVSSPSIYRFQDLVKFRRYVAAPRTRHETERDFDGRLRRPVDSTIPENFSGTFRAARLERPDKKYERVDVVNVCGQLYIMTLVCGAPLGTPSAGAGARWTCLHRYMQEGAAL